jgi:hypothetical protein
MNHKKKRFLFGNKVDVSSWKWKGKITIPFQSEEDLKESCFKGIVNKIISIDFFYFRKCSSFAQVKPMQF